MSVIPSAEVKWLGILIGSSSVSSCEWVLVIDSLPSPALDHTGFSSC